MSNEGKNEPSTDAPPNDTERKKNMGTFKTIWEIEFRLSYGGLIALMLVLIYSGASLYLLNAAISPEKEVIGIGIESVYTTVGALLSATVVALFAVTPPGDHPARVANRRSLAPGKIGWSSRSSLHLSPGVGLLGRTGHRGIQPQAQSGCPPQFEFASS